MKKESNLTEFENQVLQIASLGVWQIVTGGQMKKKLEPVTDSRWSQKTGLFVTLKKEGQVRGSMGLLESATTLAETLFDSAQTAATHDKRFPPITSEEIPAIEVHVSLLSEIKKFTSLDDLELGSTGLIVSRGEKQAVLLPHVALDHNWTAEQFLEAACEKAQLSHKAWKDSNTLVEIFSSLSLYGGLLLENLRSYI
jgi:AmmeMemoRadiSam system protein A